MKKNILVLIIGLISICSFAQKIKIDKGEIKLDGKTVGYLEGKKPLFKIYSLDKSYFVTAELKNVPKPPSLSVPWIELKNESTGKLNELEFKSRKFSPFNYDRSVIYELLDRNYFGADGLNKEVVEKFLNGESTGISAKRLGIQNEIDKANKIADTYQLKIDDDGVIFSIKAKNPDPADKRIGYIKIISPSKNGEILYEVTDLDGYRMAVWFAKNAVVSGFDRFLNEELITADQKVFKAAYDNMRTSIRYKMSEDNTAMNIVRVLVGNGYTLSHQGIDIKNKNNLLDIENRKKQLKLDEEKYEKDKLNSTNIYDKKGYVIDKNGEQIAGVFKIEFEVIPTNLNNSNNNIPPVVGKKLYQTDIKDDSKIFRSKTGVRFCIEDNNSSKDCYLGLTCTGVPAAESVIRVAESVIRSLEVDNSFFYKIVYEDNGNMILVYPKAPKDFIIKTPNQEKGLYVSNSSDNKLKKRITEYFKCDSFVFENHDFKTLEGLIKVLDDYKAACQK